MSRPLKLPQVAADTPSIEDLKAALELLTPETRPRWGTLGAAGMLRHCSRFMELYLGAMDVGPVLRFITRWFGPTFLRNFMTRPLGTTPRNMRTMQPLRSDAVFDFDRERRLFLEALAAVDALSGVVDHRLYGTMKAEDAQALVRHHTAHHFHQFGLI